MRTNRGKKRESADRRAAGVDAVSMTDEDIWAAVAEAEDEDWLREVVFALHEVLALATDRPAALVKLARTFPSLREAAGLDPWSPSAFEAWMLSDECTVSGGWSAMLVLNLWGRKPEAFGPRETMAGWDPLDLQAFERLAAEALHV